MGETQGSDSKNGWQNPAVMAAVISGAFALLGTMATGFFTWLNREPATASVAQHSRVQPSGEQQFAALTPLPAPGEPPKEANPNWLLNFAAFQAAIKDRGRAESEKERIVAQCAGSTVIWQGYVDSVTPHAAAHLTAESAATVCLCENEQLLTQSLFKQPAFCRFSVDNVTGLENLKPGDRVTISGKFSDHSAIGTTLTECVVVGPAVRQASADGSDSVR